MNARGIPTAAYQVLHLLLVVGYPPNRGTPPQSGLTGGGYLRWGTPQQGYAQPGPMRVWGYLRWGTTQQCTPSQVWWGVPEVEYHPAGVPPWPGLTGGTWGGVPPPPSRGTPSQVWQGGTWGGVPPLAGVPLPPADLTGGYPNWTWLGYPPPSGPGGITPQRCGQTETLPSLILRMWSVMMAQVNITLLESVSILFTLKLEKKCDYWNENVWARIPLFLLLNRLLKNPSTRLFHLGSSL